MVGVDRGEVLIAVAEREVEIAVGAEHHRAAVVAAGTSELRDERRLGRGIGDVGIGGGNLEAREAVGALAVYVGGKPEIEISVFGEARMKRHREQAAAVGIHMRREIEKDGARRIGGVAHERDAAGELDDKGALRFARRKHHECGSIEEQAAECGRDFIGIGRAFDGIFSDVAATRVSIGCARSGTAEQSSAKTIGRRERENMRGIAPDQTAMGREGCGAE